MQRQQSGWLGTLSVLVSGPVQDLKLFFKESYVLVLVKFYCRGQGYQEYNVDENPDLLHKPFINVYFGAAYLKWLTDYQNKYDTLALI